MMYNILIPTVTVFASKPLNAVQAASLFCLLVKSVVRLYGNAVSWCVTSHMIMHDRRLSHGWSETGTNQHFCI